MPPRTMTYRWFAKMYGFTHRQVDEDIDLDDLEWFPKIEQAEAQAAEIKQKQAARESQGKTSRHF